MPYYMVQAAYTPESWAAQIKAQPDPRVPWGAFIRSLRRWTFALWASPRPIWLHYPGRMNRAKSPRSCASSLGSWLGMSWPHGSQEMSNSGCRAEKAATVSGV